MLTERDEHGVLWITLNRPDAANAITPIQRNTMIDLLQTASADLHVRCVVITATGTRFCTGADLRAIQPPGPARPDDAPDRATGDVMRMIATGAQRLISAILDCEKPVIASVNGTAAGIGAHLALAADLVIAADTAKLIEVFVRRGIAPDGGGAWLLPRIVGLHKAKELIFFGEDLSAADALQLGVVNKVVPFDDLHAETAAWATKLATGPTKAIGLSKALLNRSFESDRATAFAEEAMVQEVVMTTHDANEGVAAFRERRDVAFKGW
ncbi:enoyl-CoA hydratase [cyanobacterium TDX16]|nr:enoyl-CoA hydratase [cyanobacterium TDX16]